MADTCELKIEWEKMIVAYCYEMKTGDIYSCTLCGFEVKIVKQGEDLGFAEEDPQCCLDEGFSLMNCCGRPLHKKRA